MAIIGELAVLVTGKTSQLDQSMRKSTGIVTRFSNTIGGKLRGAMMSFRRAALSSTAAVLGFGGAVAGLSLSVKLAADLETTALQFKVLTGSAEKAKEVLEDIRTFAAATPFQFNDLAQGGRKLIAFGVSSGEVIDKLRLLGDISAASGANIGEIVSIFGKIKSSGTVALGDLNQLGDRAIPIFEVLKTQLGKTGDELKAFIRTGQLKFDNVEKAFRSMTSEGGKFAGALDALSQSTAGKFSTLVDNIKQAMTQTGKALIEGLDLNSITEDLTSFAKTFATEIVPLIADAIKGIATIAKTAAGITSGVKTQVTDSIQRIKDEQSIRKNFKFGGAEGFDSLPASVQRSVLQQELGTAPGALTGGTKAFLQDSILAGYGKVSAGAGFGLGVTGGIGRKRAGGGLPDTVVNAPILDAKAPQPGLQMDERVGSRNMLKLLQGAGGLGRLIGGGPGKAAATPDDTVSALGSNTAVLAGSAQAQQLSAMNQLQQKQEQVQGDQLTALQSIVGLMASFLNGANQSNAKDEFDTVGAG